MNEKKKETQEKKFYEVYTYYADVDGHSKEVQVGEIIPASICVDTPFGVYTATVQVKITEDNLETLIKEGIIKRTLNFPTVSICIDHFIFENKMDRVTLLSTLKALPQMTAYVVLSSIVSNEFKKDKYKYLWSKEGRFQLDTYNLNPVLFKSEIITCKLPVFPNYMVAKYVSEAVKEYYKEVFFE